MKEANKILNEKLLQAIDKSLEKALVSVHKTLEMVKNTIDENPTKAKEQLQVIIDDVKNGLRKLKERSIEGWVKDIGTKGAT